MKYLISLAYQLQPLDHGYSPMTRGAYPVKENRIVFVSADVKSISLKLEVDRGVVVTDVRHVLDAGNLFRRDVSVLHRDQRDVNSNLKFN